MEVLILSKTKYGATQYCIGGINITNNEFVRLLQPNGYYQSLETPLKIGDIWNINYTKSSNFNQPHNEDVFVNSHTFVRKVYKLETYIKSLNVPIWEGSILNIYDKKMLWTYNGKGYLSSNINNYPVHSVGFWISDSDLIFNGREYLYSSNGINKQIVYKGDQQSISKIAKGKLIRVSLAKWWKPDDSTMEPRCYLQLSGWYEDQVEPLKTADSKPFIAVEVKPTANTKAATDLPQFIPPVSAKSSKNTSGPCYIATLCYEDNYADEVCSFRDFRDSTLKNHDFGRFLILKYYLYAPNVTSKLENFTFLNKVVKYTILNPLLFLIKLFKLDKS